MTGPPLEQLPKARTITTGKFRKLFNRQSKQCTWCGGQVPSNRRTWCSMECESEFGLRYWPQMARTILFNERKGICEGCGEDLRKWEQLYSLTFRGYTRSVWHSNNVMGELSKVNRRGSKNWRRVQRYERLTPTSRRKLRKAGEYEAHHKIRVEDGGGPLGRSNLELLCLACHNKTKRGIKRQKNGNGLHAVRADKG